MTYGSQKGYIALMSAIIISFLLMAITAGLGLSGFFTRTDILDSESKERATALAEGCSSQALLNFAKNPGYNPVNEMVAVGSDHCTIISKQTSSNQVTFITQGIINKAHTNLKTIFDITTLDLVLWQECPTQECEFDTE